jgi:miniconductance mechanosensitive channel
MERFVHLLYDYLISVGATSATAKYINLLALLIALLVVLLIVDMIVRKILLTMFSTLAQKSKSNFDDLMVANKVFRNIAHIIPLLIAIEFVPYVFIDFPFFEKIILKALEVFAVVLTLWIVRSLLNTFKDYLKTLPRLKDKPIDSYIQVFMIFAWLGGFVFAFAIITGTEVWKFLTAFGAASAVILLIFKDTILGFVASIQVSINDMVRIGDWITFEKYGADGDVIEINLATVKVQNFDKTITTIPTYALISDSFKNWRGMTDSGGRRIKRALIIKLDSIKYLSKDEVVKLKDIELINNYLETRQNKIEAYNTDNKINKELLINGRNLTNIGVFRKYIDAYINSLSSINKEMTIMVRHLEPTTQGIPIEVYAFSADKRWANYEYIMADIFDHLLASVSYFGLELFELPNHSSFRTLNSI